jgi:hypothetical protein
MNRQERRRIERASNKRVARQMYSNEAYEQGKCDGVREVYQHILLITAYIARLHFGLGKKRLNEFMTRLTECLKSFATGQLSGSDIYDIEQECRQYGYDIENFQ